MMADIAFAFGWSLAEIRALDLDDLATWAAEARRYYAPAKSPGMRR